jgi:uncharacterized protein YbjT (DUF2867 family)
MGAKALVIGSTGLVGGHLVRLLLADPRFDRVVSLARRPLDLQSPRLDAQVVDFRAPQLWAEQVAGDVLFLALGTTRKQAGSAQAQYEVDHTFQYRTAEAGRRNGVPACVVVSSSGANPRSPLFYPRMKGELERDLSALGFPRLRILRPGLLEGERSEPRTGEKLGASVLGLLRVVPGLRAWRPIPGEEVARAAVQAWAEGGEGVRTWDLGEVFDLAGVPHSATTT